MNDKIFPGDILIHNNQKTKWLCLINTPEHNAFKVISKNGGHYKKGYISEGYREITYEEIKSHFDLERGTKASKILFMPNEVNINE